MGCTTTAPRPSGVMQVTTFSAWQMTMSESWRPAMPSEPGTLMMSLQPLVHTVSLRCSPFISTVLVTQCALQSSVGLTHTPFCDSASMMKCWCPGPQHSRGLHRGQIRLVQVPEPNLGLRMVWWGVSGLHKVQSVAPLPPSTHEAHEEWHCVKPYAIGTPASFMLGARRLQVGSAMETRSSSHTGSNSKVRRLSL